MNKADLPFLSADELRVREWGSLIAAIVFAAFLCAALRGLRDGGDWYEWFVVVVNLVASYSCMSSHIDYRSERLRRRGQR